MFCHALRTSPVRRFPRGSEWRKWDLHVHAPGTKLNNGYGKDPWPRFCEIVDGSDVCVVGIADYFSLDTYFEARRQLDARFSESDKVLLPNLELRLNETVNQEGT